MFAKIDKLYFYNNKFAIIINFVGFDWQPKRVTVGLFEVIKITSQTLVNRWLNCLINMGWKEKSLHM
jgi:hypothetical protein